MSALLGLMKERRRLLEREVRALDRAIAEHVGSIYVDSKPAPLKIRDVIAASAEVCGVSIGDVVSIKRQRSVTRARQLALWAAYNLDLGSYPKIGDVLGLDHTTVLHAVRKVAGWSGALAEKRDDFLAEMRAASATIRSDTHTEDGGITP